MWVTVAHPVLCRNTNALRIDSVDGRRVHPVAYRHKLGIVADVETYNSSLFDLKAPCAAAYTLYADRCIITNKANVLGLAQEQRTH